jgi:pantoate--beta-alanine ligase
MRGPVLMKTIKHIREMKEEALALRLSGKSIGFVPTMGYFHEGHLSLMRAARPENDVVVVSLFVNPAQFGPDEDLERYPQDMNRDVELALGAEVDILFVPESKEIYPEGFCTAINVQGLSERLCGESRPGHFQGVATIVNKLFQLVLPHRAYFGLKDFQQTVVVRRMSADLNLDLEIVTLPTVREEDGLAMSSRNSYLSTEERSAAVCLKESLDLALRQIDEGEPSADRVRGSIRERIGREKLARIDYVSVSDPHTLTELSQIEGEVLVALAVYFGKTRLIDNLLIQSRN